DYPLAKDIEQVVVCFPFAFHVLALTCDISECRLALISNHQSLVPLEPGSSMAHKPPGSHGCALDIQCLVPGIGIRKKGSKTNIIHAY
ncbi:MAG: hypothetical protein PF503_03140, partial [Desulfobacula sp.]|nr:hypothetical protein [Desulfobacula sp.]